MPSRLNFVNLLFARRPRPFWSNVSTFLLIGSHNLPVVVFIGTTPGSMGILMGLVPVVIWKTPFLKSKLPGVDWVKMKLASNEPSAISILV